MAAATRREEEEDDDARDSAREAAAAASGATLATAVATVILSPARVKVRRRIGSRPLSGGFSVLLGTILDNYTTQIILFLVRGRL